MYLIRREVIFGRVQAPPGTGVSRMSGEPIATRYTSINSQ